MGHNFRAAMAGSIWVEYSGEIPLPRNNTVIFCENNIQSV